MLSHITQVPKLESSTAMASLPKTTSSNEPKIPPHILVLNAFPGTGKLTIARHILSLLLTNTPPILLDNHTLIDPVSLILPTRNSAHYALRKQIRDPIFAAIAARPESDLIVIFTTCLVNEMDTDRLQWREFLELARKRGIGFRCVNLVCSEESNRVRLESGERLRGREGDGKEKLVDGEVLKGIRDRYTLLSADGRGGKEAEGEDGKSVEIKNLILDTTALSAEESARRILGWLLDG